VHDARGELVRFVGVQVDVTPYREQRRLVVREQGARAAAEDAERRTAFLPTPGRCWTPRSSCERRSSR